MGQLISKDICHRKKLDGGKISYLFICKTLPTDSIDENPDGKH